MDALIPLALLLVFAVIGWQVRNAAARVHHNDEAIEQAQQTAKPSASDASHAPPAEPEAPSPKPKQPQPAKSRAETPKSRASAETPARPGRATGKLSARERQNRPKELI